MPIEYVYHFTRPKIAVSSNEIDLFGFNESSARFGNFKVFYACYQASISS